MFVATMLTLFSLCAGDVSAAAPITGNPMVRNILNYGPCADGSKDNTAIFQRAMDEAAAANGGIVEVPAGRYRFDGVLSVPANVTLRGTFTYSPAHAGIRDGGAEQMPVYGSVLEPHAGAGSEEGAPFITLQANATIQGFTVHYPDQDPKAEAPTAYPYTVAMRGNNPAILDMELLNPFNAIDASQNQRALIRNIHGQPIHIGVYVDTIYDIGRIENVHWNPWWSYQTKVFDWQMAHGTGFIFGRTDWHYVINTFCFGYNVGYKFIRTKAGSTNGNFLGIGADDCWTSVVIEDSAPMGILITNGEFVSFHGPEPTMVRVEKTHEGTVRFVNCAFWGASWRNASIDGVGTVGFSDCTFMQWGHAPKDASFEKEPIASMDVRGGSVIVHGCEFLENKPQIRLGDRVDRAVITDNLMTGKVRVDNDSKGAIIVRDNAGSPSKNLWKKRYKHMPGFRADQLNPEKDEKE